MDIILASKSPRRLELLSMLGAENLKVIPSSGEAPVPPGLSPGDAVSHIAFSKGRGVAEKYGENALVIAADTLVYLDGAPLGKPADEKEAYDMLASLSGRGHFVYTGVALFLGGRHMTGFESSAVFFRKITDSEIRAYIRSGEPMDKAGAYGAQGLGSVFIKKIDGDFFNVMGLPLCKLVMMLKTPGFLPESGDRPHMFGI